MRQKTFFLSLTAFLAFSLLASGVSAATYIPMSGDLIKTAKGKGIYIVDDDLKRHLFPNEATFWTWYVGSWKDQNVKVISQDDFEKLDYGKNVTVRPGTNLVRFENSRKIYAVTPGAILCEVRALYGYNWEARVVNIQESFEDNYIKDNSCVLISTGKLPSGTLIQYVKSKDVWYIDGDSKRKVSADGMSANNFRESSIIRDVPVSMTYGSGKAISGFESSLGILRQLAFTTSPDISQKPDLTVSSVSFSSSQPKANQNLEVKVLIKNLGAPLNSAVGLRNITFSGKDWSTQLINHSSYPSEIAPLGTNQVFEVTYTGKFVASGNKNLTIKIDDPSELAEASEKNNLYSKDITVLSAN